MKSKQKKLSYKEWLKIFSKVPRICVDLVIKSEKGVILTKRNIYPYKGYWHTPGGGIIFGERIKETVERVAKEELNIDVKFLDVVGVMEFKVVKNYGHTISIACLCKPLADNFVGSNQANEIAYFKTAPLKTIKEQREFLVKHKFLKNV